MSGAKLGLIWSGQNLELLSNSIIDRSQISEGDIKQWIKHLVAYVVIMVLGLCLSVFSPLMFPPVR